MTESMVSAGHYNALRLERDQLAARVSELENIIATGWQALAFADAQGEKAEEIAMFVYRYLSSEVEKNAPAQSLLIHDAELMESEAKVWLRDGNATSMYSGRNVNCVLSARARELRDDAEGKA
jgi:hypothetical protein